MFDPRDVIDVSIVPIGEEQTDPYDEYKAPSNSAIAREDEAWYGPNVRYITPPAGQRFAIRVCVHPMASFMGEQEFDISCTVDGLLETWGTISRPPGRRRLEALTEVIDTHRAVLNGRPQMCGLAFAAAKTRIYCVCSPSCLHYALIPGRR